MLRRSYELKLVVVRISHSPWSSESDFNWLSRNYKYSIREEDSRSHSSYLLISISINSFFKFRLKSWKRQESNCPFPVFPMVFGWLNKNKKLKILGEARKSEKRYIHDSGMYVGNVARFF